MNEEKEDKNTLNEQNPPQTALTSMETLIFLFENEYLKPEMKLDLTSKTWNLIHREYTQNRSLTTLIYMMLLFNQNKLTPKNKILLLNEMLLNFLFHNYITVVQIFIANKDKINNFLIATNGVLMLIEVCIFYNYNTLARKLLDSFEAKISNGINRETLDPNAVDHLNNFEIYNEDFTFSEIVHLYKCIININERNYDKASSNLVNYKNMYRAQSEKKKSYLIYMRMKKLHSMLKIKVDFYTGANPKFFKHLKSFYGKSIRDDDVLLYYYNSLGLMNLKLKNLSLAQHFFNKCYEVFNENLKYKMLFGLHFRYNIALCNFMKGEYEKCLCQLNELKEFMRFKYNPYIYFRMGLCLIEMVRLRNFDKEKYMKIIKQQEEKKKIYIQTEENFTSETKDLIIQAINNFQHCINITEKIVIVNKSKSETYIYPFNELDELFTINDSIFTHHNKTKSKTRDNSNDCYSEIYINSYLNILFCLTLLKSFMQVILLGKSFLFQKKFKLTEEVESKVQSYLIQAYIYVNKPQKAFDLIQNLLNKSQRGKEVKKDFKCVFYSSLSGGSTIKDFNFKIALHLNLIRLHFSTRNFTEALICIKKVIKIIEVNDIYPPNYLINLLVFYCLETEQKDIAKEILATRKIPNLFRSNG